MQNEKWVIRRKASQLEVFDGELVYKKRRKLSDRKEVPLYILHVLGHAHCCICTHSNFHIHKLIGATNYLIDISFLPDGGSHYFSR